MEILPQSNAELGLQTRILNRLQDQKAGQTFAELVSFLSAPEGEVRAALYDLAEARCARFSEGKWHLE